MNSVKKVFVFAILILFSGYCISQSPQAFKYQAVARNVGGSLLSNTSLTVRVGIRDLLVTGVIVYQETFSVTTNQFGLININIGTGAVTTGTFTSINWGTGDKFIEIEIDYGTGFVSMGISQLLSVPYALYAANGPVGSVGPAGPQGIQGPQGLQGSPGLVGAAGMNGISLNWLGTYTVAPVSPVLNNAYYNPVLKKSFMWNGASWQVIAQDGADGPPSNNATYFAYSTGSIVTNPGWQTIPGMSLTLTVPAGMTGTFVIHCNVGVISTTTTQCSGTDVAIFINGSWTPGSAGLKRVYLQPATPTYENNVYGNAVMESVQVLGSGIYTFDIRGLRQLTPFGTNSANVGGASGSELQGMLMVQLSLQ